jgi:hypothetical protein
MTTEVNLKLLFIKLFTCSKIKIQKRKAKYNLLTQHGIFKVLHKQKQNTVCRNKAGLKQRNINTYEN